MPQCRFAPFPISWTQMKQSWYCFAVVTVHLTHFLVEGHNGIGSKCHSHPHEPAWSCSLPAQLVLLRPEGGSSRFSSLNTCQGFVKMTSVLFTICTGSKGPAWGTRRLGVRFRLRNRNESPNLCPLLITDLIF